MTSRRRGSCGRERKTSVRRIRTRSAARPKQPARAPTSVPMVTDISIAAIPTAMLIRPPQRIRASMSWPRSLVPSGWAHDGGAMDAWKSMVFIPTWYTSGPTPHPAARRRKTTAPAVARRCLRNLRHASAHSDRATRGLSRTAAAGAGVQSSTGAVPSGSRPALPIADPRVEEPVEHIGHQVEEHDEDAVDEGDGHDHRRVAVLDGGDEERADPRNAENLLGDHGPREHGGQAEGQEGDDRDQAVAEDVPPHHPPLGNALGARRPDVVLADVVEHRRPHEPHEGGGLKQGQDAHGHDGLLEHPHGVPDLDVVDERQPVEADAEEDDEQHAREEGGQGEPDEGARGGDLV